MTSWLQEFTYRESDDMRLLRMLEALLAAGYRPTVYRNVVLRPHMQPVAVFDPLKEYPQDFSCSGLGR